MTKSFPKDKFVTIRVRMSWKRANAKVLDAVLTKEPRDGVTTIVRKLKKHELDRVIDAMTSEYM